MTGPLTLDCSICTAGSASGPAARLADLDARDLLPLIEAGMAAGISVFDPSSGRIAASAAAARLWGVGADAFVCSAEDSLAAVHPDDRADVASSDASSQPDGSELEFRVIGSGDEPRHLLRSSWRIPTEDGIRVVRIDRDVTELRQLERALFEANAAAQAASKSKTEFLAHMSHELRTPLNAVMGFAQVMRGEFFGPLNERYRDYAEQIDGSAEHLLMLINDILDLARIEAARNQLKKDWISLARITEEVAAMMRPSAGQRGVELEVSASEAVHVWGDIRAVKQMLLNLLSNAIKFTDAGGRVDVEIGPAPGGGAALVVRDTGIGIPPEDVERVREPFVQASNVAGRDGAGTGLGLAIVVALVELHGGRIAIESTLGRGTAVTVTLPSSARPSAAAAAGW